MRFDKFRPSEWECTVSCIAQAPVTYTLEYPSFMFLFGFYLAALRVVSNRKGEYTHPCLLSGPLLTLTCPMPLTRGGQGPKELPRVGAPAQAHWAKGSFSSFSYIPPSCTHGPKSSVLCPQEAESTARCLVGIAPRAKGPRQDLEVVRLEQALQRPPSQQTVA